MTATSVKNQTKKLSCWAVLWIVVLSMTALALCMFKVPPLMGDLIAALNLSGTAQGGFLMSIFSFAGIILAIPAGLIITRYGMYKTGAFSLICSLVGSLLGVVTQSYALLLIGRIIEGVGLIFIATLGPAAIGSVFAPEKRGLAMGIMMSYMSVGQFIMFNVAPRIAGGGAWKNAWWLTAVYSAVMLVLWIIGMRRLDATVNPDNDPTNKEAQTKMAKEALSVVIKNPAVWLIGVTFALMLTTNQGVLGFLAQYLSEVRGMDASTASTITSLASIIGIPTGLVVGAVSDKLHSRRGPMIFLFVFSAIVYIVMPHCPTNIYWLMSLIFGIATMGLATLCFAAVPEVIAKPEQNGMACGVVNTLEKVGVFLSTILFGALIEVVGWSVTFYIMAPICILGIISVFINKKLK